MVKFQQFTFEVGDPTLSDTINKWLLKHQTIEILHAQWIQQGNTLHYFVMYYKPHSMYDLPPCNVR